MFFFVVTVTAWLNIPTATYRNLFYPNTEAASNKQHTLVSALVSQLESTEINSINIISSIKNKT